MKIKLFILSALTALACVSCEQKASPEAEKTVEEINTIDEEMTEKGNTPAYEARVKEFNSNGEITEYTMKLNCFEDMLSTDKPLSYASEYEYKYNSDGLVIEISSVVSDIYTVYTYDVHGEIVSEQDYSDGQKGYAARYENEYDENGNLIAQNKYDQYPDEDEETYVESVSFTYDGGKLISKAIHDNTDADKPTVNIEYEYDDRGNIISEIQNKEENDDGGSSSSALYSVYNSHNLPATQEMYLDGEIYISWEYEYTFYDE